MMCAIVLLYNTVVVIIILLIVALFVAPISNPTDIIQWVQLLCDGENACLAVVCLEANFCQIQSHLCKNNNTNKNCIPL